MNNFQAKSNPLTVEAKDVHSNDVIKTIESCDVDGNDVNENSYIITCKYHIEISTFYGGVRFEKIFRKK